MVHYVEQISHLMSVSSYPGGGVPMLRANVELISGLVGLFGENDKDVTDQGEDSDMAMEGEFGLF